MGYQVRKVRVEKRHNDIVNRLQKTKEEKFPDLRAEREQRDHKEAVEKRKKIQQEKQREKEEIRKRKEQAELRFVKKKKKKNSFKMFILCFHKI